jgi:transcriptional regulator with XRE-family HTH domain
MVMGGPRYKGKMEPAHIAAHDAVRLLFDVANTIGMGVTDLADRAGVNRSSIRMWRRNRSPGVDNLEACLNVIGYRLVAVKIDREEEE